MTGIGDETIAPTRKRADFHLVTLREKGLCNREPEGVDAKIPAWGNAASSSKGSERASYNGYYPCFPSKRRGFDSHRPLHSSSLGRLVPDTESPRTRKVILPAAGVPHYPGMTLLADR